MPALRPAHVLLVASGLGFVAWTGVVGAAGADRVDARISAWIEAGWNPAWAPFLHALAVLGGIEVAIVGGVAAAAYLLGRGFGADAWAPALLVPLVLIEWGEKHLVRHPGPPRSLSHHDGPGLLMLLDPGPGPGNSYPSGHILRVVFVFGLLAFLVLRLSPRAAVRGIAVLAAAVIMVLMAWNRVALQVHWASDVIGGALLGLAGLAAAITWLDRPRPVRP